jgi:hypothetical protein
MEELFRRLFGITGGIQEQPVAQAFPIGQGQVDIAPISAGDMPIAQPQDSQGFSASQFLPSMDAMRNALPSMENLRGIIPTFAGLEGRINQAITPQLPAYMKGLLGADVEAALPEQARRAGLLNAAAALMQASGPQSQRVSLGQALGAGLQGYQQGSQGAFDQTLKGLAMRAELQPKDGPGTIGQYEAALRKGYIPKETTLKEFNEMIKSSGTVVNVNGEASPFNKEAQKLQAQNFAELSKESGNARRKIAQIDRLEGLLKKSPSGLEASAKVFAGNFGIPTKGLDNLQAAQAIINQLVPQQRPPGSGTMSDADLALFKQSLPRVINQPGGNALIIQTMREINQYLVKEGEIANQAINGKITPEEASRRISELANPLANFESKIGGSVSSDNFQQLKTDDINLINRYLKK